MDRAGVAVLLVLAVALMRVGDSHKDATGGRKEGAGADRAVWDQPHSPGISQGHSPGGPRDGGASSRASGETSPGSGQSSRTLVRQPRGTATGGASREEVASAPRDGAQRTARQTVSQQQRTRVNRRQSSKPGSAGTRRLVG